VAHFKLLLLIVLEETEKNDETNPVTIYLSKFKLEISVHLLVDTGTFPDNWQNCSVQAPLWTKSVSVHCARLLSNGYKV
jgi:hypothetical protein